MIHKAKKIKDIQIISNTILANGCYSEKEMENQIAMAERQGKITKKEIEVICKAWDLRIKLAHELIIELENYLKESE